MTTQTQNNTQTTVDQHPLTAKAIESLRANRYEFVSTLGELVDNSLDADATIVDITIEPVDPSARALVGRITIGDNGDGMDKTSLFNSFTIGAERKYVMGNKGKFGLGGTMSCLGLAARKRTITKNGTSLWGRFYDMEMVEKEQTWVTQQYGNGDQLEALWGASAINAQGYGTIIILDKFDRKNKKCSEVIKQATSYLGKTFSEQLKYGDDGNGIVIKVNGVSIDSACPVASDHHKAVSQVTTVEHEGNTIRIQMVDLTDVPEVHFGKKKQMVRDCGMYFAREERLIASHIMGGDMGWAGGRIRHPHLRHARALIKFSQECDREFGVSASKDSVNPSQALMDKINEALNPFFSVVSKKSTDRSSRASRARQEKALEQMQAKANSTFVKPSKRRPRLSHSEGSEKNNSKKVRSIRENSDYITSILHESNGPVNAPWRYNPVEKILTLNDDHGFIERFFYEGADDETLNGALALPIAWEAAKMSLPDEVEESEVFPCIQEIETQFFRKLNAISSV